MSQHLMGESKARSSKGQESASPFHLLLRLSGSQASITLATEEFIAHVRDDMPNLAGGEVCCVRICALLVYVRVHVPRPARMSMKHAPATFAGCFNNSKHLHPVLNQMKGAPCMLFPNMTSVRIAVIWERERVSQILRDYEAPPPYEPGGGMPSDTALLRWNTLPLEAKRQLAPMVEDEQIQLCWGTLLLGADDPVLHAIDAFSWARGRGEQRDELLVAEGLQSVLAQCVRGPGGPAFGVGPEEVAAVVSLIYGEARRDARTAFNAGSPTFHVVSQALVDERGQACAKRYRDVPPSLIAVWSEIYPLLFSIHFSTLTGQGGDEPDYLDESTLWYFSEEELHAYTHNVLCAAVAMDYRAWLAGKEQSFYHHPNSSFARQQGNFGFLAMIGEEGWAEIQPGQTAG